MGGHQVTRGSVFPDRSRVAALHQVDRREAVRPVVVALAAVRNLAIVGSLQVPAVLVCGVTVDVVLHEASLASALVLRRVNERVALTRLRRGRERVAAGTGHLGAGGVVPVLAGTGRRSTRREFVLGHGSLS